jgi:AcrR family transcriptional regulator
MAATEMFCELGYERVSLRNISDKAGVSHALIRHHFGTKEKIWYTISDMLHSYIKSYMQMLLELIPAGTPANEVLYQFEVRILAHLILVPEPLQFIADVIRQEGVFFDYFLDQSGEMTHIFHKLADDFNAQYPDHQIRLSERKWVILSSAHAAISLKPMLKALWIEDGRDADGCLYQHWQMFHRYSASSLFIPEDKIIHPQSLEELLLPMATCWKKHSNIEELFA